MTAINQEFVTLKPDNTIYKLVGPILVPQVQSEAKLNVDTRLDFIRGDMCAVAVFLLVRLEINLTRTPRKRIENQIKELGDKAERAKSEVGANMSRSLS